jgi:hypothetical protein
MAHNFAAICEPTVYTLVLLAFSVSNKRRNGSQVPTSYPTLLTPRDIDHIKLLTLWVLKLILKTIKLTTNQIIKILWSLTKTIHKRNTVT